jgi:hypothetical protein
VEFWTTNDGKIVKRTDVQVTKGDLRLTLPQFGRDIAFKVKPGFIRQKDRIKP